MLPKWHLTENSMVSTSTTQFIRSLCFPYVYVRPCEAHVLRLGFFLKEDRETQKIHLSYDRETQKIPLIYALNYATGVASDAKFHSK